MRLNEAMERIEAAEAHKRVLRTERDTYRKALRAIQDATDGRAQNGMDPGAVYLARRVYSIAVGGP